MDDTVVVTIRKPVPTSVINSRFAELAKAADDAEDQETRTGLAQRARELAAEIAGPDIRVTMCTATRRQAIRRGTHRRACRQWLVARLGVASHEDVDWASLDDETELLWMPMWQAGDIVAAMVSTEGWDPPDTVEGWADVPDFIFTPLLAEAWALNPHWRDEALSVAGNA